MMFNKEEDLNIDSSRRFSARYLLLHYADVPANFDPSEIRRLVGKVKAQCVISKKRKCNDTIHFMAFVSFNGPRFQTRNLGIFDVQGQSPEWHQVRSAPWKVYDHCLHYGDLIYNEAPRPKRTNKKVLKTGSTQILGDLSQGLWEPVALSNDQDEFLNMCMTTLPIEAQQQLQAFTTELTEVGTIAAHQRNHTLSTQNHTSTIQLEEDEKRFSNWKEGFRAGFEAGLKQLGQMTSSGISAASYDAPRPSEGTMPKSMSWDLPSTTLSPSNLSSTDSTGYDLGSSDWSPSNMFDKFSGDDLSSIGIDLSLMI